MDMTPKQIVAYLDDYIIGQNNAKKTIALALRNRYRRMKVEPKLQEEIMPKNILMIGNTGVGKTEIARRMAKMMGLPFVKVEASKYTEVGFVGRDVESMIRDLVYEGINLVTKEFEEKIKEKIDDEVNRKISQIEAQKKIQDEKLKNNQQFIIFSGIIVFILILLLFSLNSDRASTLSESEYNIIFYFLLMIS